jgi:hypothetical protein
MLRSAYSIEMMPHPRVLVAGVAFAAYLALALVVGNLYPVSTFEMYSSKRATSASRVVARDGAGAMREIDEYESWSCDGPTSIEPAACAASFPYAYTTYLDRAAVDWIDAHRGQGGEPVDVVRRIYRLGAAVGPPAFEDCVLQQCRAVVRR